MVIVQSHPGAPLPGRAQAVRQGFAARRMATLQVGHLHAVAAGAGCSLAQPFPDDAGCWHISRPVPGTEVTVAAHLVCLAAGCPPRREAWLELSLDNDWLVKLARTPVSVPRILVVMVAPRTAGEWRQAGRRCYWANLAGHAVTGRQKTNVRIPTSRIFDDRALGEIMTRVGAGGRP